MTDAETIEWLRAFNDSLRAELTCVKADRDDLAACNDALDQRNQERMKVIAEMLALIRRCASARDRTDDREAMRAFLAGYERSGLQ